IWPTAPFNPPIKPLILSPDSGISKTKRSSNVISPNGLLSSLWVWQHKDESNPFLFATQNSSHHVLFEQRQSLVYQQIVGTNPGRSRVVAKQGQDNQSDGCGSSNDRSRMYFPSKIK